MPMPADADRPYRPYRWLQGDNANPVGGVELESAVKSFDWLGGDRELLCENVRTGATPLLDEQGMYPATSYYNLQTDSVLEFIKDWRGGAPLVPVARSCPLVGVQVGDPGECEVEATSYINGLIIFGLPVCGAFFFLVIWYVCCCVACCRCCRRCCLCSERKGPRVARRWQRLGAATLVAGGGAAVVFSALVAFVRSSEVAGGIADMLCQLMTFADEALNGSEENPEFLGIDVGIHHLGTLRRLLDVDGRAMTDVRSILDQTANFASAMDALLLKIGHMERVLSVVGERKIKEHACAFCRLAVGNNATGEMGLLTELKLMIQRSSADAMRSIQNTAESTLTGQALVDISAAVRDGTGSLEVFKRGFAGAMVSSGIPALRWTVQVLEDARHTIFRVMCIFCMVHGLIVSSSALWYARSSKAKYPSAQPSCVSWFCGFCSVTFALLSAGLLLLVVVPFGDMCDFWRYELLTHTGLSDYYQQLGFVAEGDIYQSMDPLAVDVARTCLTPNGTGNILEALRLTNSLRFQQQLEDHFVELEDKSAQRVVDTAKFELLVARAQAFSGLFNLDPDQPLPLEPASAPLMMGSSVDPDDQEDTDGETLVYGLNTYASLIGEPGDYAFEHGTAGGGTLITATLPTPEDVSDLPAQFQNALHYARLKEQLLSEPDIFRCDVLDSSFQVTEISCGYEAYRQSVIGWAEDTREAALTLSATTAAAQQYIASDLKRSLEQVMQEVRLLNQLFRCRFLWKRWEDFEVSMCQQAVPGMVQGSIAWMAMSVFSMMLVVGHYKLWRHFKDNQVVGNELERFSKKYGYLQIEHKR